MKHILFTISLLFCITSISFAQQDVMIQNPEQSGLLRTSALQKQSKALDYKNGKFFTGGETSKKQNLARTSLSVNDANYLSQEQLSKSFTISVDKAGTYYFAANVLPSGKISPVESSGTVDLSKITRQTSNDIEQIRVYINEKLVGTLKLTTLAWELAPLKESEQVSLRAGDNTVRFECNAPFYPTVDAVRITQTKKDLLIANESYEAFLNQMEDHSKQIFQATQTSRNLRGQLQDHKLTQEEVEKLVIAENDKPSIGLKSAMLPNSSYTWQTNPVTLSSPHATYKHKMQVPITFTYYRKLSVGYGNYMFYTGPIEGNDYYTVDPVMYLYKADEPYRVSIMSDDAAGYGRHCKLTTVGLPAGDYYLVVRAYSSSYATSQLGRQGLVHVYCNGSALNTNMPIAGYMVDVSSPNKGSINYFTAYTTGIPVIWLQENTSGSLGLMRFKSNSWFYKDNMDFMWWDDVRMELTKNSNANYSMLISAEGAMGFYFGNCDVYGSVMYSGDVLFSGGSFPNLKRADAMQSAPVNSTYNCTSWAGGITSYWYWGSSTYGNAYIWSSWDNYYGNKPARYAGAITYTRDQADSYNGEIAMWSTNGSISGVTHGSVRMAANNHPHGYDWESKCGQNERVFHPRNALRGWLYGDIFAYYRDASKSPYPYYNMASNAATNVLKNTRSGLNNEPVFTLEESIKEGLTVIEEVTLDAEQEKVLVGKGNMLKSMRATNSIADLYNKWVNTFPNLALVSNPYQYAETPEGKTLFAYAKANPQESIIFFGNLIFSNDEKDALVKNILFYTFPDALKEKYGNIMENIKEEWQNETYTSSGTYIAPSPETFTRKYVKALLDKDVLKRSDNVSLLSNATITNETVDNDNLLSVYPNPVETYSSIKLNLPHEANVTIQVFNSSNILVQTIINSKTLKQGEYSYDINVSKLGFGINYCRIIIDGKPYSRKLLKR